MIHIVKDWYNRCNGCGKVKENTTLVIVSPEMCSSIDGTLILCPKCRRELIKKLIANKED